MNLFVGIAIYVVMIGGWLLSMLKIASMPMPAPPDHHVEIQDTVAQHPEEHSSIK
jgi:hypothetical protein